MDIKKVNNIFGYVFFIVGVLKILLLIYALSQILTILDGGNSNFELDTNITNLIGFVQIALGIGSIIMIILNIKEQSNTIIGYVWGLGALLIELFIPSIYIAFIECGMYMKAGSRIIDKNKCNNKSYSKIKQDKKNTEWFYGNNDR